MAGTVFFVSLTILGFTQGTGLGVFFVVASAAMGFSALLWSPVLSRMTITDTSLNVRSGLIRHEWQWDQIAEVRLVRRKAHDQLLIARYRNGRQSRMIQLAYWMTPGDATWPSEIVEQIDRHGIQISDNDRRTLLTEFTNRRTADRRPRTATEPDTHTHVFNPHAPTHVRVLTAIGLVFFTAMATGIISTAGLDVGIALILGFIAVPFVGLPLWYTPLLSRLTISNTTLTVRVGGRSITVPWGDVQSLSFTEATGQVTTRSADASWALVGLTLKAQYRDGTMSGAINLDAFARPGTPWPTLLLEQVDAHNISISADDRQTLLTGYGSAAGTASQPGPHKRLNPWCAIALGAIAPAVTSALVVIVRNWQ